MSQSGEDWMKSRPKTTFRLLKITKNPETATPVLKMSGVCTSSSFSYRNRSQCCQSKYLCAEKRGILGSPQDVWTCLPAAVAACCITSFHSSLIWVPSAVEGLIRQKIYTISFFKRVINAAFWQKRAWWVLQAQTNFSSSPANTREHKMFAIMNVFWKDGGRSECN